MHIYDKIYVLLSTLSYVFCHLQVELYRILKITVKIYFDVLLTVHLSIFISVINQLDAQNICFTISLFHASTCF